MKERRERREIIGKAEGRVGGVRKGGKPPTQNIGWVGDFEAFRCQGFVDIAGGVNLVWIRCIVPKQKLVLTRQSWPVRLVNHRRHSLNHLHACSSNGFTAGLTKHRRLQLPRRWWPFSSLSYFPPITVFMREFILFMTYICHCTCCQQWFYFRPTFSGPSEYGDKIARRRHSSEPEFLNIYWRLKSRLFEESWLSKVRVYSRAHSGYNLCVCVFLTFFFVNSKKNW